MTPLSKISLAGPLLFQEHKMNEMVNKILLVGDQFMSEMCLKQPRFIYSDCRPFTKKQRNNIKF